MNRAKYVALVVLLVLASSAVAEGVSKFWEAVRQGNTSEVRALVEQGADVNESGGNNETPVLVKAAKEGHLAVVELLLFAGADINAQNVKGTTALHAAARRGHTDIVQLLLAHNADHTLRDKEGRTAESIARAEEYSKIARLVSGTGAALAIYNDFAPLGITAEKFQSAAKAALVKRGWTLSAEAGNSVQGVIARRDITYKSEIRLEGTLVYFLFLRGYGATKVNYLQNLERDFTHELKRQP
ncbi:MAG: ankyrin repeat domain-containing protein [Pseudomonadota bacterium]|nr:MAG: ankyrin repeat domain-containing protein [Pseudomonadota bacterium]